MLQVKFIFSFFFFNVRVVDFFCCCSNYCSSKPNDFFFLCQCLWKYDLRGSQIAEELL